MSTCSNCATPFGPGDRRCLVCGLERGAPVLAGSIASSAELASDRVFPWVPMAERTVKDDLVVDTGLDDGGVAEPGHREVRVGRRAIGIALVMILLGAVVVGAFVSRRATAPALVDVLETPLRTGLATQPTMKWKQDFVTSTPPRSVVAVAQDSHLVYVDTVESAPGAAPVRSIIAFDGRSGTKRWDVEVPALSAQRPLAEQTFEEVGGLLLVGEHDTGGSHLRALAKADGTTAWNVAVSSGQVLVLTSRHLAVILPSRGALAPSDFQVISLIDGSTRWRRPSAGVSWSLVGPTGLLVLESSTASLLGLDDGVARWSHAVASGLRTSGDGQTPVLIDGQSLVALGQNGAELWRRDLTDVLGGQSIDKVEQFGASLLMVRAGSGPLVGIDPRTGALRWTDGGPPGGPTEYALVRSSSDVVLLGADQSRTLSHYDQQTGGAYGPTLAAAGGVSIAGDMLYLDERGVAAPRVGSTGAGRTAANTISAYDLITFRRLWSVSVVSNTRVMSTGALVVTLEQGMLVAYG